MSGGKPLAVNGWTIFAHPIFLDQLDALTAQVEALQRKDPAGYEEWLVDSCAPTVEVRYLLDAKIVAVSLLDLGATSANSAYHYFDPKHADRSLGVYSVLKEIELCRARGMRWYYLGLWVEDCKALRYKTSYLPHERLVRGTWRRFDEPEPVVTLGGLTLRLPPAEAGGLPTGARGPGDGEDP